jgi:hypothetical protein
MHSQNSDISCLMQYIEPQPEYYTTAPGPRRCVSAFSLARQPRRSARVCSEHARCQSLTCLRPPSCPPHLRPEGGCRRPPPLCALTCARPSPPAAGYWYNDVYRFSAAANTWTALSPSGSGPSRRSEMGFASTPDGLLYVFGGWDGGIEGGGVGSLGCLGLAALDAVMRRARAAPLLLSLSIAEGTRVKRAETCTRA